jgi:tetratricopeptide (TPR) repeat protein
VVTIFQLGNLYSYRGQLQKAQKTYENLLKKSPRHPGGQLAYAKTLLKLDKPEVASRILISAFLEERYYQSNNFKNLVTESLRRCPKNTSHKGLISVINDREILSDSQLFQKFQTFQAEKRKRNY